jgi:hypothetical protein
MMKSLFSIAAAVLITACTAVPVLAEATWAQVGIVCNLETVKQHVANLKVDQATVQAQIEKDVASKACVRFSPVAMSILEVVYPYHTDFEGDRFVIIRVGSEIYSLAWPGFNSPIVEPEEEKVNI